MLRIFCDSIRLSCGAESFFAFNMLLLVDNDA